MTRNVKDRWVVANNDIQYVSQVRRWFCVICLAHKIFVLDLNNNDSWEEQPFKPPLNASEEAKRYCDRKDSNLISLSDLMDSRIGWKLWEKIEISLCEE